MCYCIFVFGLCKDDSLFQVMADNGKMVRDWSAVMDNNENLEDDITC
jgi:hypothetical protein